MGGGQPPLAKGPHAGLDAEPDQEAHHSRGGLAAPRPEEGRHPVADGVEVVTHQRFAPQGDRSLCQDARAEEDEGAGNFHGDEIPVGRADVRAVLVVETTRK